MAVQRVLLAEPRGFCAGVEMAIKALAWMVRSFEPPVYCYHEIVHNRLIVERFEAQGVVFVDDIAEVPPGSPIMLSAHGSAPEVVAAAQARGSYVVDSVCPLVTKVHHEVRTRAGKGYRIVYVGHEGHEEAVGTMAVAPSAISRVEHVADVAALPQFDEPVALLAQTTLSHRDWEGVAVAVRERYPDVWSPGRSDLCFATTNRQGALMALAERCDAIVVIGSANSSNTRALEKLAHEAGCQLVARVNEAGEIPDDVAAARIVGVTAGASAPNELVVQVIERLAPVEGVEVVAITDEDEYFPPPRKLRELQTSIETAATVMVGGSMRARERMDDRALSASDVLTALAGLLTASQSTIAAASCSPTSSWMKCPAGENVWCGWPAAPGIRLTSVSWSRPSTMSSGAHSVSTGRSHRSSTSHAARLAGTAGSSGPVGTSSGNCRAPAMYSSDGNGAR